MKTIAKKGSPSKAPAPSTAFYEVEKHLRTFCQSTSQQLGTVLGTILGELDYALNSDNPQTREHAMRVSLQATESALRLSRNLSYFATHSKLETSISDLSQLVIDTVELIEKELEGKGVTVAVFVEANTFTQFDSNAMQQVILNLLYNACHAMPEGGRITVNLRQREAEVELRVQDTGHGVPPALIDRIFDPYFSFPEASLRGQGLGLAVTKALVESHGGTIQIQSREGVGSTFAITLPFDRKLPKANNYKVLRKHRRVAIEVPAEVILPQGHSLASELTTLSLGGCFVAFHEKHPAHLPDVHDSIQIKITYFGNETLIVPSARVASVSWMGPRPGIGLEFQSLDDKTKHMIHALVQSHSE